jgi:hypothetical protein
MATMKGKQIFTPGGAAGRDLKLCAKFFDQISWPNPVHSCKASLGDSLSGLAFRGPMTRIQHFNLITSSWRVSCNRGSRNGP